MNNSSALTIVVVCAITWLAVSSTGPGIDNDIIPAKESVRLYVIDGGSTYIDDKALFDDYYAGSGGIELEVPCFLVVHPRGILMWDSGHSDSLLVGESGGDDRFRITVEKGVASQMLEIGINPAEVDLLAASHWHFDHTGNFNLFASGRAESDHGGAILIGQRDEVELAFNDRAADTFGMKPSTYMGLVENPTDLFIGDRDVFGDGTVRILRASGHTIGSQVLFIDLENYGPILLSGDLYHFAEQREHHRVPPFNHDLGATLESMDRVEAFLGNHPGAELWITHDPVQMSGLRMAPSFYD